MTTIMFAHTYRTCEEAEKGFEASLDAKFALVLHKADGTIETVDSNEYPAYCDEGEAVSAAMFAIVEDGESCDVIHCGEYFGTAEFIEGSGFFASRRFVYSPVWTWED